MMTIAKGIKGIRSILAEDKRHWHVTTVTEYLIYYPLTLSEIRALPEMQEYEIIGFTGNGICVSKKS